MEGATEGGAIAHAGPRSPSHTRDHGMRLSSIPHTRRQAQRGSATGPKAHSRGRSPGTPQLVLVRLHVYLSILLPLKCTAKLGLWC